ncbi:MAG: beta-carotene ketolase [Rickettsiales bacterium]|nr:beta-carotene ketolase [Rickettsiales bacterium]|tara:strand:- start:924 stop:1646 length:723 start_codon:yes stop_codon:yes gene_type:complete
MTRQSCTGLVLSALILTAWSGLHVYALFFHPLSHWAGSLILMIALTWLSVGLFILAHDAMHGSLAPEKPALGHALGAVALALYAGFTYARLLPQHHRHHDHAGTADDPDFHAANPKALLPWYWQFMRTYFGWREVIIMQVRVTLYWLMGASIPAILVFFALPGIVSSMQLFYFGTWLPHRHQEDAFADHHHARSNAYGWWWSLISCFHFGYHHEHHLSPRTPWWALPAKRRELQSGGPRP